MREKITLPICGQEIELVVLDWVESKAHMKAQLEAAANSSSDVFVEEFIQRHYPKKVWELVKKARPDVMTLFNDTVRLSFGGPEAIKNSSRSGIGAPTQTAPSIAENAGKQTPTD